MNCLLCGHDKVHRHGKTEKGQQRYKCPCCGKTFPEHFDSESGLILAARVGKHTDRFLEELVNSTEGKTDCQIWNTDDWGGDHRVLPSEINHQIGKEKTQRLERTNGIIRQQTGRRHRRQNKFGKLWEQPDCDSAVSHQLFQLALGQYSPENYSRPESWTN